jgi:hypothetical protein
MNVGRFEGLKGVEAENPRDIQQTPQSIEWYGLVTCLWGGWDSNPIPIGDVARLGSLFSDFIR